MTEPEVELHDVTVIDGRAQIPIRWRVTRPCAGPASHELLVGRLPTPIGGYHYGAGVRGRGDDKPWSAGLRLPGFKMREFATDEEARLYVEGQVKAWFRVAFAYPTPEQK